MLLWKKRIQGNAQWHSLLIEKPANPGNTPIYRVSTKRLVNNIRIARNHIRPKIRAVSITPHLNIENEADRDLFPPWPRFYVNGFSRQSGYPVACIFTECWA